MHDFPFPVALIMHHGRSSSALRPAALRGLSCSVLEHHLGGVCAIAITISLGLDFSQGYPGSDWQVNLT